MESNSQTIVYTLSFMLFFDLVLLISLVYYFKKLGYPFIKFGAVAIALEMFSQCTNVLGTILGTYSTPYVMGGLAKMFYTALLLACVANIVNRKVPVITLLSAVLLYLLQSIQVALFGGFDLSQWLLSELPGIGLLSLAIYWLFKSRVSHSPGNIWLAWLIVMYVVLKIALPLTLGNLSIFSLIYFYQAVVASLIAAVLIVITSEWMLKNIRSQDVRIEEVERENKRLELQFAQAQKLESLGLLAGGIAHDFNNMLTSILGYVSLAIKKTEVDSELRKDLYMVMSGARQAVDLTSQMLTYAGKGAIEFESLDLSRVVDNMSSLINSVVPRKIKLVQNVGRKLPVMKGDQVQLGQVLMNLVANSVDAIGENAGQIDLSTGLMDVDELRLSHGFFSNDLSPGTYLYLRVKDNGVGMDADQVDKIFDPFYSDKSTGKGLGLSSLSGIVRQHKGFIEVNSEKSTGSEFTAYFPVIAVRDTDSVSGVSAAADDMEKGTVLLAEDDSRIRGLISSILEGDGFTVVTAEDGKDAINCISERGHDFSLFVLDCTMPKYSGSEVYGRIRERGLSTPVVLISGYYQDQVVSDISNDSSAHFIKKPFNVDDLLATVNGAL